MLPILIFLTFFVAMMVGYSILPPAYSRVQTFSDRRQQKLTRTIEQIIPRQRAVKMGRLLSLLPLIAAVVFYLVLPESVKHIGVVVGLTLGLILPSFVIKMLREKTQDKFSNQLIDALMIMSSSFRGGLSLVQAMEAVVEEMPDPINREFGTVLGENKMGVSLEDALTHLYNRMPSPALQQMNTAILLARETGGNLPVIFTRIVNNIREAKKIQQNLDTLTIQGKIQGVVMSLLPVAFGFLLYSAQPRLFENMLQSKVGQTLLIYAVFSEIIGAFFIWKISRFRDF